MKAQKTRRRANEILAKTIKEACSNNNNNNNRSYSSHRHCQQALHPRRRRARHRLHQIASRIHLMYSCRQQRHRHRALAAKQQARLEAPPHFSCHHCTVNMRVCAMCARPYQTTVVSRRQKPDFATLRHSRKTERQTAVTTTNCLIQPVRRKRSLPKRSRPPTKIFSSRPLLHLTYLGSL